MRGIARSRFTARRRSAALALGAAGLIAGMVGATPAAAAGGVVPTATSGATAAPVATRRSFSCTGDLGLSYTVRTVAGQLTSNGVPVGVTVTAPGGIVESSHPARATLVGTAGSSWLHAGFNNWDVTGPNPNGDLYNLHVAPVLPGNGGFFDADLEISFAGGVNGSWQIPMFDCTVTGGPAALSLGGGPRTFACAGALDIYANYTITGQLTGTNTPFGVKVTQVLGATLLSNHPKRATLVGAVGTSWLHTGYNNWDVTGANPNGDLFNLHIPPVLPRVGGFFDATFELQFAGGAFGNVQVPMFDCTVK
jgi:hypothetical protein